MHERKDMSKKIKVNTHFKIINTKAIYFSFPNSKTDKSCVLHREVSKIFDFKSV